MDLMNFVKVQVVVELQTAEHTSQNAFAGWVLVMIQVEIITVGPLVGSRLCRGTSMQIKPWHRAVVTHNVVDTVRIDAAVLVLVVVQYTHVQLILVVVQSTHVQ